MDNGNVKSLQIIVAALAMGVISFGLVTCLVKIPTSFELTPLAIGGMMAAIGSFAAALIIRNAMTRGLEARIRNQSAQAEMLDGQLFLGFQGITIVTCALLESGCLINLVFNLLQPNWIHLVCAFVLLAALVLYFPTAGGVQQWITARREAITGRRNP